METITIQGKSRGEMGKKSTKAVRRSGNIPCVIYGGKENIHFTAPELSFRDLIYTPDFKVANISVDGNEYRCILKTLQAHPVTDRIQHIDFIELVDGQQVIAEVPVRFTGVSPGVKNGGKLMQKIRRVKIKTTPDKLVDELLADISEMILGSSIRVRDIQHGEDIEILNEGATPIASVEVPRALRSAEAAAGEAGAEEEATEGAEE